MALRNHPSISAETRERVQALAKQLNYRGNILVSALLTQVRRQRVDTSGEVIAMLTEGSGLQHAPMVAPIWDATREHARQLGLKLELFPIGHRGKDSAMVNRVLFNRGIRGLIISPMPLDLQPLHLDWENYAVVALGHSFQQHEMNRVSHAHFGGLLLCYRKLRESGRSRIGCVMRCEEDSRSLHYWQGAALCAPRLSGGKAIPPLMMDGTDDMQVFNKWVDRHRPDALIGCHPDKVIRWLKLRGLRVPEDLVYASLDIEAKPGTPGVRQSWAGIFATAVDQLAGELARNEFGLPARPKITLVDGEWRDGDAVQAR